MKLNQSSSAPFFAVFRMLGMLAHFGPTKSLFEILAQFFAKALDTSPIWSLIFFSSLLRLDYD